MHRVARIAAVAASLVLMGQDHCGPPTFEHPLPAPDASRADPRILGTWYGTCFGEDASRCFLHVRGRSDGDLAIILVQPEKHEPDAATLRSFVSRLGDRTYLNVHLADDDEAAGAYVIVRYAVEKDGALVLRVMRTKPVRSACAAGDLTWTTRPPTDDGPDVTSPTQAVAAFVRRTDESTLFEHFGTLRRVRLPEVRASRR